ncbi:MAG: hypothetical protein AB8G11_18655 [Saprospiraceae bacterium]
MKWINLMLLLSLIVISSCNDDNDDDTTQYQENLLLKKVYADSILSSEYEYNLNNKIEKIILFRDGIVNGGIEFTYDEDTIYEKSTNPNANYNRHYWIGEDTAISENYNSQHQLLSYSYSIYTDSDCGHSLYVTFDSNHVETNRSDDIEYIDDNCSVSYGASTLSPNTSRTFQYDDKRAAGEATKISTRYKNKNKNNLHNVIKVEYFSNGEVEEMSFTTEYLYNSLGYPISAIQTNYNGVVTVFTYEYY